MKTEIVFCSLVFIFLDVNSTSFKCGPDRKCLCDSNKEMNCSGTLLPIKHICEYVNISTENRVSVLYLERNTYKSINQFDLKGCDKLLKLHLRGNEIRSIENGSFTYLSRLQLLDISKNMLDMYDEKVQRNFTFPATLKTLMLYGNLIPKTIDSASYPNVSFLTYLSTLYMDGLHGKMFSDTYLRSRELRTLILSGLNGNCNMSHITNSTFRNLPYLRTLNISSCNIENINAGAFKHLSKLENLDLSWNLRLGFRMLNNVSYGLQFTNIKVLNYSHVHTTFGIGTQLKKRDICYIWNTTLREAAINSNRIQLIETNAGMLLPDSFRVLRIEDNKFTFGPYLLQLGCNAYTEEIYASYQNKAHDPYIYEREPSENNETNNVSNSDCPFMQDDFLRKISKRKKNCHFFESDRINIDKNLPMIPEKLRRVDFSVCNMQYEITKFLVLPIATNVEYLDFSGNIFHSWKGPIGPFPNLKHLNLSRNYCSYIGPHFFESMQSIEDLQLQQNFLGLVLSNESYGPVLFENLTKVKVLNLSSNIISYLPPRMLQNMFKLETLDLSVNNIDTWTVDVRPLNSILHLKLKFNFFHNLPAELRNKLKDNSNRQGVQFTIDLSNNTFTTYCDEKEYLKWMVEHRSNMINFDSYIFHDNSGKTLSPEQFVAVVNGLDKACRSYTLLIVLASVGLSVFLAIVIGGFIYKNRWQLRYLMRISKIRHFGYKKLSNNPAETVNFTYDAFISYANENIRFILDKIIQNLESDEMKLCVHDRDFLPGNNIADNILEAIRNSRKTVVVLSKDFLRSKWCIYEFNMARMESIYSREGANCLVIVMLEDVPTRNMSTEMIEWIRSNTYIEYTAEAQGEELFWQNLKVALIE